MANVERDLSDYEVRPLTPDTWDAFADLCERHNGVFGGCWCTWFHTMHDEKERTYEGNRELKKRLVDEGRAHAALVFDGDEAVAWAEYGTPRSCRTSTTASSTRRSSTSCPTTGSPASSSTSATAGKDVSAVALQGALRPDRARPAAASSRATRTTTRARRCRVLYNGTRSLFERAGFDYVRPKGTKNCVMRITVPPAG